MKVQEDSINMFIRLSSIVVFGAEYLKFVMAIKKIVLLGLFFVGLNTVSAQQRTILSLRPSVGIEFPMNHVYEQQVHKQFRYNNMGIYPQFGLSLQYELSDRLDIFGGWNNGATGYSFAIFSPDNRPLVKHRTFASTQRFPLGFHWELKDVWLFRMQKRLRFFNKTINADERILYLILFRLKATFGLSYNYLSHMSGENKPHSVRWPVGSNKFVSHLTQPHVANRHGLSLFGGLTFQFYNYKKDKVQLSILYNQGFIRQYLSPLQYTMDEQEYSAMLGSRGSYFAATLTYPIRLASFSR
jgi:hypothetical protein